MTCYGNCFKDGRGPARPCWQESCCPSKTSGSFNLGSVEYKCENSVAGRAATECFQACNEELGGESAGAVMLELSADEPPPAASNVSLMESWYMPSPDQGPWPARSLLHAEEMILLGAGFCKSGYYAGWDAKIATKELCFKQCLAEEKCSLKKCGVAPCGSA